MNIFIESASLDDFVPCVRSPQSFPRFLCSGEFFGQKKRIRTNPYFREYAAPGRQDRDGSRTFLTRPRDQLGFDTTARRVTVRYNPENGGVARLSSIFQRVSAYPILHISIARLCASAQIYLASADPYLAIRVVRPACIDYPRRRAITSGIARVNRRARENTVFAVSRDRYSAPGFRESSHSSPVVHYFRGRDSSMSE